MLARHGRIPAPMRISRMTSARWLTGHPANDPSGSTSSRPKMTARLSTPWLIVCERSNCEDRVYFAGSPLSPNDHGSCGSQDIHVFETEVGPRGPAIWAERETELL